MEYCLSNKRLKVNISWALGTEDMYACLCTGSCGGEDGIIGTWSLVTAVGSGKMGNVNSDFLPYSTETFHKEG